MDSKWAEDRPPVFLNYDDALAWIEERAKAYGSRDKFLSSNEYKKAHPTIRKLYQRAKKEKSEASDRALAEAGIEYGDRVYYDVVSPFGFTGQFEGTVVKKRGIPYVRLDRPHMGRRELRWHKGWLPVDKPAKEAHIATYDELLRSVTAVKTKPSYPNLVDEHQPSDPNLWETVLDVASGKRREFQRGQRTIHAPNDGRGYRNMPHNPKGIAWAVKQYNGFGANWKTAWDQRLRRMASGGVELTEGSETAEAQKMASEGLLQLAGTKGDRHYWDITAKGLRVVMAGLKEELVKRVDALEAIGKKYGPDAYLTEEDKKKVADFAQWFRKNFRVDSAKTPKGQKMLKEEGASFLKGLEAVSQPGGSTYARVLQHIKDGPWGRSLERDLDDLVQHFTTEGDRSRGKEEALTEIKGSNAVYLNRANMSNANFQKYAKRLDQLLGTIKGWHKKALTGTLKVVFVGRQQMTVQGKYKQDRDELWVLGTPRVLKRSGGYGSPEYIIVHELGHRYEKKIHPGYDFDRPEWWTTSYSRKDGEAFAELFALSHFNLTGSWSQETVKKFERLMTGKEKVALNWVD